MSYADKIRHFRRGKVTIDGKELTYLRPTDLDMAGRPQGNFSAGHFEFWTGFVVDWDFVESDLIPGGNNEPVPFDLDDFREWFADRGALWLDLVYAIRDSYKAYKEKESNEKKT